MPLIPRYTLSQTTTHVNIEVSVPHVRVSPSTLELVVDGTDVHLYAPPTYLLKLILPERVVDENFVDASLNASQSVSNTDDHRAAPRLLVQEINDSEPNPLETENSTTPTSTWTDDDLPKMQYDPLENHGTIIIILRKEVDAIWDDLDLLGRLQQPSRKDQHSKQTLVTVCDEENENSHAVVSSGHAQSSSGIIDELNSANQRHLHYGLFRNFSNVFRDYAREGLAHEMLECPNPDEPIGITDEDNAASEEKLRRAIRLNMENDKFDVDRYLADLYIAQEGDMIFDSAIGMVPHWMATAQSSTEKAAALNDDSTSQQYFTAEESQLLATLPHKSGVIPNLTTEQQQSVFLALADILFAYAYDHRTTDGDPTVESSWTVMILSPSLAWLENYTPPYDTLIDVIRWCIRRSLIYPYLRSTSLAMKLVQDVAQIFMKGRRVAIRCLLQLHRIMEKSESRYLFNKLYIDPLIWWTQNCEEDAFTYFGQEIESLLSAGFCDAGDDNSESNKNELNLLDKQYLGLGLDELECSLPHEDDSDSSGADSDESSLSGRYKSSARTNEPPDDVNENYFRDGEQKLVQLMQSLDFDTTNAI